MSEGAIDWEYAVGNRQLVRTARIKIKYVIIRFKFLFSVYHCCQLFPADPEENSRTTVFAFNTEVGMPDVSK